MANYTDDQLAAMEKQLNEIYKQSQEELQEKWDKYMVKAKSKVKANELAYLKALSDGDPAAATAAKDAYEKVMLNMTLHNKHYQEMVDQVTDKLANTNQLAIAYLNDQMPGIYCHSFNELENQKIKGYSFELVDEETVKYVAKNIDSSLLPQKQLNIPKDKLWNTKNINSQVMQGILQGESIPKISQRLQAVTDMNHAAAVRNARTMTTNAECKGRMDSYTKAANEGVIMKKVWISHHSERTRDWHADLSGVELDITEPFKNDYGEIMYPGDPTAHPANVYNCRCSIKTRILGFKPVEKTISAYASNYQGTGVTAQYYSMLDEDKALGNAFWKTLNSGGKPSQVWKEYLAGSTPKELTNKLDDLLAQYKGTGLPIKPGTKKAVEKVTQAAPKPDMALYQDKSMTATFYSVKAENTELGKEFWAVLQAEDNPSFIWSQYVGGVAPKEITEKLDKILLQHKGTGAWSKPASTKNLVLKAEYNVDSPYKLQGDAWNKLADIYSAKYEKNGYDYIADLWTNYKAGKLTDPDLDKFFKEKVKVAKAAPKAAVDAVKDSEDLLEAQKKLAVAQGNLDSLGTKTYSGIWQEDVTLADYEAKAGTIQAKKDYFYAKIEEWDHKHDNGEVSDLFYNSKIKHFEQHIDELVEFESKGKLYAQYEKEYKAAAAEVKKLTPVGETFGPDAYTQTRREAALWAKTPSEYRDLDKYYDKVAKQVHDAKSSLEHEGYYHYTWGSGPFNSPLAGFKNGFNTTKTGYLGPGKVDIDVNGYGDRIRGLTSLIEKSKYDKDIWIQSGQYEATLEGMLNIPYDSLWKMSVDDLQQFVGVEKELPQFISGSINKGGGSYLPGNTLFNIYCPSGSEMLYVREDGYFHKDEHEMILQRGGTYKITRIYRARDEVHGGSKLIVDMELHPEKGYNKFQQVK